MEEGSGMGQGVPPQGTPLQSVAPQGAPSENRGYWIDPPAAAREDDLQAPWPQARKPSGASSEATQPAAAPVGGPPTAGPRAALQPPSGGPPVAGARPSAAARRAGRTRHKSRRRRLLRLGVLLVVLAGIATAVALIVTGRTVVPVVSGQLYPVHYAADIGRAAERYDLDPYLVAAVAKTESSFDPGAVSPAGAVGIMQLMPDTAEWITGLDSWQGAADPVLTDAADSLELGACYLAYLAERFHGQTRAVLAAYNAGPGNVGGWVETAGGLDEFGVADIPFQETRDFVLRVERFWLLYTRIHPDVFTATGNTGQEGG